MSRTIGLATASVVLVSAGIVHGVWTHRWTSAAEVKAAVARLERVPLKLGDWEGEDIPLTERDRLMAGGDGYLMRRYQNRQTGAMVSLLLVCGRPGPVSVHTPDICYREAGFTQVGDIDKTAVEGISPDRPPLFRWTNFRKAQGATPLALRVFWSWGVKGEWTVPRSPRLTFAGEEVLHKLYMIRPLLPGAETLQEDPGIDFLKTLLPELRRQLFSGR
jgi:hypothetical protein